jgi:periplasmic protein CpxP/Spy
MRKSIISTLVTLSFAAAAPLAVAQSATPSAAPQRSAHAHHAFRMPSERTEARLAYVKTALKITDAQAPQWDAYANVVRKQAQTADQRMQERRARIEQAKAAGGERKRPTAIERLERRQQFFTNAAARSGELLTVQKPLYAALSPEQQRVADELFASRGHRGSHRGMRHGRA